MLLDLLEKLQGILKSYKNPLDDNQIKNLAETLNFYNDGIVPAKVIKGELKISYVETHKLMTYLSTKGILVPKYKVYCENDFKTGLSKVYNDPSEVPLITCDRCEKECFLIKNLVVEFEVHI